MVTDQVIAKSLYKGDRIAARLGCRIWNPSLTLHDTWVLPPSIRYKDPHSSWANIGAECCIADFKSLT